MKYGPILKLRMSKRVINSVRFVIAFVLGWCVCSITDWGYFELSKEISVIDALSLFVTTGCAIYIARILEKDLQNDRTEKDIYIKMMEQIEGSLVEIQRTIEEQPPASFFRIVNLYSRSRKRKSALIKQLSKNRRKFNKLDIDNFDKDVSKKFMDLKPLLTSTDGDDVKVQNNEVQYSSKQVISINTVITDINDIMFEAKLDINNS